MNLQRVTRVWPGIATAFLAPLVVVPLPAPAQAVGELAGYGPMLDSLLIAEHVPGLSFAFFNREGVLWEHVSGTKNADSGELVGLETVFEAASISKPVFSALLHLLADEGLLEMDRPLVDYSDPVPGLGHDPRSALLTPRMLLSHQGGVPNWRTRINLEAHSYEELFGPQDTLRFVADPGMEYRYSGEGFLILQRVVEDVTAETVESLAASRLFGPLGMTRTSFSFDALAKEDYAVGHSREGQPNKFGLRATLAGSTLHTSARDLARFGAYLASEIRGGGEIAKLAEPQVTVEEDRGVRLSWGLGLGVIDAPNGRYLYHGGNNVIFIADFIYDLEEDIGYVLLTNSANGDAIVNAVEERVFGRRLRR